MISNPLPGMEPEAYAQKLWFDMGIPDVPHDAYLDWLEANDGINTPIQRDEVDLYIMHEAENEGGSLARSSTIGAGSFVTKIKGGSL